MLKQKLYLKVIPNPFNDSGYVICICKGYKYLNIEVGRVTDRDTLDKFLKAYQEVDGQELELK